MISPTIHGIKMMQTQMEPKSTGVVQNDVAEQAESFRRKQVYQFCVPNRNQEIERRQR